MNEKVQKNLKNSLLTVAILLIAVVVLFLIYYKKFELSVIFTTVLSIVAFFGYLKAKKGEKVAGIIGMVVGILMILTLDIINLLLGIFLLIHAYKYDKEFR